MSVDIKRLLNKKGWTGREVGQALLLNLTDRYEQTLKGTPDPEPLFTQDQISQMMQTIVDPVEGAIYNRHVGLHHWLMQYHAVANAFLQQLQGDINALVATINTATAAEEELLLYQQLPVIMTQKQYDEYVTGQIEKQLKDKSGEDRQYTAVQMVSFVLSYLVGELAAHPKKANPLKGIRKKYLLEKITDPHVLNVCNKVFNRGYYLFPDGRRSDQMSDEEWEKAILTPEVLQALKDMEKNGDIFAPAGNRESSPAEMATEYLKDKKQIWKYMCREDADFSFLPCSWTLCEEPLEDLCKWDIIEEITEAGDYYPALFSEGESDAVVYLEELRAFKKEFAEAVDVALKIIDKKLKAPISRLPEEEWSSTQYSMRHLYEIDFPGMRDMIEDSFFIFGDNIRALTNGIAILQANDFPEMCSERILDENGYYIEPKVGSRLSASLGLECFTPANEDYIFLLEEVERQRRNIERNIYWLKAFDHVIARLAALLDIPGFVVFQSGLEPCLDRIDALNGIIEALAEQIKNTLYPNMAAKEAKLQVLSDVFYHFAGDEIGLTDEAKDSINEAIADLSIFELNDGGLMLMFLMPEEEEG